MIMFVVVDVDVVVIFVVVIFVGLLTLEQLVQQSPQWPPSEGKVGSPSPLVILATTFSH